MLKTARGLCAWLLGFAVLLSSNWVLAEQTEQLKFNMTRGVTPVSQDIHGLHMLMFWWCVGIGVVVFGIMFFSMFVHRKSRGVKPANFHESTILELTWTAIPFAILIAMGIPASKSLIELYDTSESQVDVLITGYQWRWKYEILGEDVSFFSNLSTPRDEITGFAEKNPNYLLEVDEPLVLPVDKKVRFIVTANDVIHNWWVPAFGVKRDAIPGYTNESWAVIEEPGVYRGQCAELCGKDHGFMPIVVEAKSEADYRAWLEEKKAAAAALAELTEKTFTFDELYAKGEEVYNRSCAACHQASGEGVPGAFPSLKEGITVGPIEQHIDVVVNGVPGTAMQAFGEQLSEVDIAAVVTYERNAWANNMGDLAQPLDIYNHKQGK
ncbi:cytochrome c oxidase subunit II [Gilvimarinus agarilyticus]|uniref:cytochrome c oxidase subunit II n=1 Tax=unclassified Gilvimarinus TaxID=2642066 RepID=UPI001C086139|nr:MULTISPECIES: cytochrome c oxidase subunit II [unclassified Gilvimarinus]MBU2884262.1 cytochrome c oxidase subunit II [Gilvimarinus agarilyticus]MDO6569401.1 cytochrome c oxidase subunit II [Gilvimarinus sp. 2_MG-2023]MDO6747555.1 cytochrome c oxidase subunit II [Gilvimarinus sp. 1_MG-2023]